MYLCAGVASLYVGIVLVFIGGQLAPPMWILQWLGPIRRTRVCHCVPCSCGGRCRGIGTAALGRCVWVAVFPRGCPLVPLLGSVPQRLPDGVPLPLGLRWELTRILGGSFVRWSGAAFL